ncbi:hypothetical protein JCM9279_000411 [Rhodotorula babjevae]
MAEDQRAFVSQTRDLLTWLGELPGVTAADEDELRSMRLTMDEHWMDYLPLERDALSDELVAVYCDSCAADRLELDSPTFRSFKHHLTMFAPPSEDPCVPRTRLRLPDWVKLDTLVWDIVELYKDSRKVRAWKKAFSAALRESTPTADDALARAQSAVQPPAERFAAYADLLACFSTLYKTKGGPDADEVERAARLARTSAALQHFVALGPRQPQFLTSVRNELYLTCEESHRMGGYLPPSRALLGRLLQPLLEANAPSLRRQSTEESHRTPTSEHEVLNRNYPHVWRHISDKLTELTRPYKSQITGWRREFKAAVSPDKLRRLDEHAQGVLVQCLEKRTQGLWMRARPESVPVELARFPNADDCLADAQYDTQTVGARFDTYQRLLGAFARLYETKGGTDLLCARHTAFETHKPVARQHFALLRDQEHAFVMRVRAALVQACRTYVDAVKARLYNPLPPADHFFGALLRPLFTIAGAHLAATEQLQSQFSMQDHPSMHSLAHAVDHRPRISDHYCRRYYGTTAAAWAARDAGRGA